MNKHKEDRAFRCDGTSRAPRRLLRAVGCGLALCVGLLFGLQAAGDEDYQGEPPKTVVDEGHLINWFTSLEEARERARIRRAPIFVVAGADWCAPCRQLDEEMKQPAVQSELERWLAVHLDVDDQPREATELGVSSIPALRVLTPDGGLVASQEGAMSADELVAWLVEQRGAAGSEFAAEVTGSGAPNTVSVLRILREFKRRDPTLREAAISRLSPYPEIAAPLVVARYSSGSLSEQLAALELYSSWGAPVEGLDPWIRDSLTPERLARIEAWLTAKQFSAEGTRSLSAPQLVEAERIIRMMLTAEAAAAASMREQLARMGPEVLPLIQDALVDPPSDLARERLTAARYRLAATRELVVAWPGGLERLASSHFEQRVESMQELAKLATSGDEELLLTLFTDPAPLIREMSLRTLNQVGGTGAKSALVRLLDDPEPNVRAAVLKQLAASPSLALVPKIAEYAAQERDPDLVVHAIRFLREIKDMAAVEALVPLFQHSSWRVRAEAVEAVTQLGKDHGFDGTVPKKRLSKELLPLLNDEDEFVVGRAVQGLESAADLSALEPLVRTADQRLELAPVIIRALAVNETLRRPALPHLKRYCDHEDKQVRAAAVTSLLSIDQEEALPQLKSKLADPEEFVRIAAADAIFENISPQLIQLVSSVNRLDEASETSSESSTPPAGLLSGLGRLLFGGGSSPTPKPAESRDEEQPEPEDKPEAPSAPEDESAEPPTERELKRIRTEQALPKWVYELQPSLTPLLSAEKPAERVSAARVLAILGQQPALPILDAAADELSLKLKVASCLPGLLWEERLPLFDRLTSYSSSVDVLAQIAEFFAKTGHPQAAGRLLDLLAKPDADARRVKALLPAFQSLYFPGLDYYELQGATPAQEQRLLDDSSRTVREGTPWQRLAGLLMHCGINREETTPLALQVFTDNTLPHEIRIDAFKVALYCAPKPDAESHAVQALADESRDISRAGLAYLTLGQEAVSSLSGGISIGRYRDPFFSSAELLLESGATEEATGPIVPALPPGLTASALIPFLDDGDATAAQAGYLLTMLDDPQGLPALMRYCERYASDASYSQLLVRAIAHADQPEHVAVLSRIYAEIKQQTDPDAAIKEFYWTIRPMTGPEALELRKQIRDENRGSTLR